MTKLDLPSDWKAPNARGYITFRFDKRAFRASLEKEMKAIWDGVKSDLKLYKQLLEILGQELTPFVPYDTGELARFYTDSKNGLLYRRFNKYDGWNVAVYQYNHPYPNRHKNKGEGNGYIYDRSYRDENGKWHQHYQIISGKEDVHPKSRDHWADAEAQAEIWPAFLKRATPLIVKSAKKRGKK